MQQDFFASANKENKNSTSSKKTTNDPSAPGGVHSDHEQPMDEDERSITPKVIPLPPPQSEPGSLSEGQKAKPCKEPKSEFDEEATADSSAEIKKPKRDSSPQGIIAATKSEVHKLLQEVIQCNETSIKSKICLRLEELLTRCILRLDDLKVGDSQELRQQRKAVIELIDKCTDILQRKVQLNSDIQQLSSK